MERGLLEHLRDFLLELGQGFAFLGSQYHLQIGTGTPDEDDYYLDLLFYHVKLRCYVIIDLKTEAFKPEHAGKMNFYLAVADDLLKGPQDAPSIGLILCKTKNNLQVEYALRGTSAPLSIAEFRVLEALPPELESSLPTIAQLEAELGRDEAGTLTLPNREAHWAMALTRLLCTSVTSPARLKARLTICPRQLLATVPRARA